MGKNTYYRGRSRPFPISTPINSSIPLFRMSSTMKVPMRPIMQALEFHISAVCVNPRNAGCDLGCTLGTITPSGSLAALTRRHCCFRRTQKFRLRPWPQDDKVESEDGKRDDDNGNELIFFSAPNLRLYLEQSFYLFLASAQIYCQAPVIGRAPVLTPEAHFFP